MGFWKQIELFFKALEKTFEDVGKLNKNTDRDLKKGGLYENKKS